MGPRVLRVWGEPPDPSLLAMVVRHLEGGGLVGMPTETVYGFGGLAEEEPILRLQRLKEREDDRPFLVLIPGPSFVPQLVWTRQARELAEVFWPGALSLVLADPGHSFPPGVRSPSGGVAVRVSPQPLARALVETLGRPLLSTSANLPGERPALSASEALESAAALGAGKELWVLDGGTLEGSEPSTVVDCTGNVPRVLRAGAVPVSRLRCVLPEIHEPT